jgi:hypothetical protein
VAFLHMQSKSLIEADLLLNLPATEQVSTLARVITYNADRMTSIRNHPLQPMVTSSRTHGSTGL